MYKVEYRAEHSRLATEVMYFEKRSEAVKFFAEKLAEAGDGFSKTVNAYPELSVANWQTIMNRSI